MKGSIATAALRSAIAITALGAAMFAGTASAAFPEKPITFIVPFGEGGGYDTLARAAAPVMSEALGQPVVVKNVKGGGGLIGYSTLYKAEPDGYTVGVLSGGSVVPQLVGKAQYDLNEMSWLGTFSIDRYLTGASTSSGFKSLEDLKKDDEVLAAVTGLTTIDGAGSLIMGDKMGYNVKTIGHNGSKQAVLSTLRGDTEVVTYPLNVMMKHVEAGKLQPLWVSTHQRVPALPDVPTLAELGYPNLMRLMVLPRLVGAPPGVPEERMQVLREAFAAALQDPKFKALVVEKNRAELGSADPAAVKEILDGLFAELEPYKPIIAEAWK